MSTADQLRNTPPPEDTYLGDGVRATFDGWYITLAVEHGEQTWRVHLEPPVYQALVRYADGLGFDRPEPQGGAR